MQVHATTDRKLQGQATSNGWDVVKVPSSSNPNIEYTVDITLGRCSCPAWTRQREVNGVRKPCKHLVALGFKAVA